MSGIPDGVYAKNGVLILNKDQAESMQAELVTGGAYEAVIQAQREQIAAEETHRRETGDVGPIRDAINRIKAAMQDALTQYHANVD